MKTNYINLFQRDSHGMSYSYSTKCDCHPETCNCKHKKNNETPKQMKESIESKVRNLFSPIKNYIAASGTLLNELPAKGVLYSKVVDEGTRADANIELIISEVNAAEKIIKEQDEYIEELKQKAMDYHSFMLRFYSNISNRNAIQYSESEMAEVRTELANILLLLAKR